MIKAAFFDLDETLVDADYAHKIATEKAFAYFGYDYREIRKKSLENYSSMGKRVSDSLRIRRDAAGITEQEIPIKKLLTIRENYFLELIGEIVLLKGAREIVRFMKEKNVVTAIVSSGVKTYIEAILEAFHLKEYVSFIISGEDVIMGKPNPECYFVALSKAQQIIPNLHSEECLVFEDTEAGVTAGNKAGMKVVLIPTPISIMPTNIFPDYQIKSLLAFDKTILS